MEFEGFPLDIVCLESKGYILRLWTFSPCIRLKKSQQTKRALPTKVAANFKIRVAELFIVIFCVFFSQIYSLSILFNLPFLLQLHLWQKQHMLF